MFRSTSLALFALAMFGCGGNGDGDGSTDQQPANSDKNPATDQSVKPPPPKMDTYELPLSDDLTVTVEAPSGMEVDTETMGFVRLGTEGNYSFYVDVGTLSFQSAKEYIELTKNEIASRKPEQNAKILTETENTLIFEYEMMGLKDFIGHWSGVMDEEIVTATVRGEELSQIEKAIGWLNTMKVKSP